ncbi:phosphonate ABC transporter substrate-binding protein [Pseudohongiella nitratireducens]|uniref:Phosphonate ABC transporter substrate-binding protein n=1 Tax=Pseudohongiella nitratireducens TaxID=1768907 RepID=A0A916QK86_9GAMM|nr:phosphate/phosphite/phosphonate ABC transporter substrate-binding protein [Pseudohongiella nitratireducens]GFZ75853.1 phosphonate ABC transporter substrate-binding protein [Pseudohongiella nitratireducens]
MNCLSNYLRCSALRYSRSALLLFLMLLAGSAVAQQRGLSPRYQDANDDLVADNPALKEDWRDPRILVFAYTPVEDPALYARVWDDFIQHLSDATDKEIRFFPVQSNAAQLEAMRAGRLHIAGFNTGSTPVAVNCSGFVPFAMMAGENGQYGYEMELITYPGSDINSPEDLRGKKLAFTSPTSNSGFKAPVSILEGEFNLTAGVDYESTYSGSHDNSILGVVNGDYPAAAVANEVLKRMVGRGVVSESQYRMVYRSQTFPTTAYGIAHDLAPALASKIRAAFFDYDWEGSALAAEFADAGMSQFIPVTYQEHWSLIRDIDRVNDTTYYCD